MIDYCRLREPGERNYCRCPTPTPLKPSRAQANDKYRCSRPSRPTPVCQVSRSTKSHASESIEPNWAFSDAFDDLCSFRIKLRCISVVRFFLALFILQSQRGVPHRVRQVTTAESHAGKGLHLLNHRTCDLLIICACHSSARCRIHSLR